jgi:taurine dioxygenase
MRIERPEPRIGAIVTGVDVNRLAGDEWRALYDAWLSHNVLVVRDQALAVEQFLAYSRLFGRLKPHRVRRTHHPLYPELTVSGENARKADGSTLARGQGWHTDGPWDTEIVKATQLYAVEVPSTGGDTLFANMYAAYDALPESLRKRIEGLEAEFVYGERTCQGIDGEPEGRAQPCAVHSIVRTHSETGRKALYVNPIYLQRIVGLPEAQSAALIDELFSYMVQPSAEYRHRWEPGDLVIWDNRSSIHCATGGYPLSERRIHWRVTIMEDMADARSSLGRAA